MPSSLLLAAVLALSAAGEPRLLERILAVVDGKPILLSEARLTEALKGVARREAVEALVDERLMLREARQMPRSEPRREEIDEAERTLVTRWPAAAGPAPEAALREMARRQLRILKYIEFRFRAQARVDDQALREAYDAEVKERGNDPGYEGAKDALRQRLEARRLDAEVEAWVQELRSTAEIRYNPLRASAE